MPDPFDHCEALVRAGDKDRFLATLFAPQKYRRALYALYAFNLEVARVREAAHEPIAGEVRLQWWREVLEGTGRGAVEANPVAAALRDVVVRYRLPLTLLGGMIDARAFDLYNEPMASREDFNAYAMGTAAGLLALAARILSDGQDRDIGELANQAGTAYAIAGLLRALPIHAARGQLYLPAELMQRYGAQAADVFALRATTELRAVLAELRLRTRRHLAAARDLLPAAPAAVVPALLPVAVIQPTLARMERRGYQPFEPIGLPQWRRQWALWRAARTGMRCGF
jgi:phytoene synthase